VPNCPFDDVVYNVDTMILHTEENHKGLADYACPQCGIGFVSKKDLNKHKGFCPIRKYS
jgi:hypothetical protein